MCLCLWFVRLVWWICVRLWLWVCNMGCMMHGARGARGPTGRDTGREHTSRYGRAMSRHAWRSGAAHGQTGVTQGASGRCRGKQKPETGEQNNTGRQGNTLGNHRNKGETNGTGRERALEERGETANVETPRPSLAKETRESREDRSIPPLLKRQSF